MARLYVKDPQAVLDYVNDWSAYLAGDTIATSTWTARTGITINSTSHTATTATVWLSGGTVRTQYLVTNHITTTGGRQDDRSILISCEEQ